MLLTARYIIWLVGWYMFDVANDDYYTKYIIFDFEKVNASLAEHSKALV